MHARLSALKQSGYCATAARGGSEVLTVQELQCQDGQDVHCDYPATGHSDLHHSLNHALIPYLRSIPFIDHIYETRSCLSVLTCPPPG